MSDLLLYQDLPTKSSQFSMLRPTQLEEGRTIIETWIVLACL